MTPDIQYAALAAKYGELLKLTLGSRSARKKFERSRQGDDLKLANKAEERLDEFLKPLQPTENTPNLFPL